MIDIGGICMKIAICDDDLYALNDTERIVKEYLLTNHMDLSGIARFDKPKVLIKQLKQGIKFDIYILDIIMPDINGIELAREIRTFDAESKILFVTVTPEYGVNSYEVNAFYYLLKPIQTNKFFKLLDSIKESLQDQDKNFVRITNQGNILTFPIHSILYIEVLKHKIHYYIKDNKVYTTYGSLKNIRLFLSSYSNFIQCHKSFIVNLAYVNMLIDHNFKLKNEALVPISRQYYKISKKHLITFMAQNG